MTQSLLSLVLASLLYGLGLAVLARSRHANARAFPRFALVGFALLPLFLLLWNVVSPGGILAWFDDPSPWTDLVLDRSGVRDALRQRDPAPSEVWTWIACGCALATALGALAFAMSYGRRLLLERRTQRVPSRELAQAFAAVCERLGLTVRPRLRVAESLTGLATVGWRRPCVLVSPRLLDELDPRELKQVLFHEIGHLVERDYLWHLLESFLRGVFCWNPFVRRAGQWLHDVQERDADQFVVERCGIPRAEYAACLARMALRPYHVPLGVSLTGRSRTLERVRILRDGDGRAPERRLGPSWIVAFASLLLVATGIAAVPWATAPRTLAPGNVLFELSAPAGDTIELAAGQHHVKTLVSDGARLLGCPGAQLSLSTVRGSVSLVGLELRGDGLRVAADAQLDLLDVVVDCPVVLAPGARVRADSVTWLGSVELSNRATMELRSVTARGSRSWKVAGGSLQIEEGEFAFDGAAQIVVTGHGDVRCIDVALRARAADVRRKDLALIDVRAGTLTLDDCMCLHAPTAILAREDGAVRSRGTRFEQIGVALDAAAGNASRLEDAVAEDVCVLRRSGDGTWEGTAPIQPTEPWRLPAWSPGEGLASSREAQAFESAIAWLLAHQSRDGRFDSDGLSALCAEANCGGGGRGLLDVGTTALALCCLMRDSRGLPEVESAVEAGLQWLVAQEDRLDRLGAFGSEESEFQSWEQALAITVFSWRLRLRPWDLVTARALTEAVRYGLRSQCRAGGWSHGHDALGEEARERDPDLLTTAFFVHALGEAQRVGVRNVQVARLRACNLVAEVPMDRRDWGRHDVSPDHLVARAFLKSVGRREFDVVHGPETLAPPRGGETWLGLYLRALCDDVPSQAERDEVLARFETAGHRAGSVSEDPDDTFQVGRLQATALAGLLLCTLR